MGARVSRCDAPGVAVRAEAVVALGVLAASALWVPETLPDIPLCPLRALVDLPCPGCGLTRAFTCIAHGRWAEAWAYNALAFPLFAATLALLLPGARPRAERVLSALGTRGAALLFAAAWVWNLARIVGS